MLWMRVVATEKTQGTCTLHFSDGATALGVRNSVSRYPFACWGQTPYWYCCAGETKRALGDEVRARMTWYR